LRAASFETKRQLRKIGTPVDRQEWDMTPPTVNAYYDPQNNDINFPAGILQLPFFDTDRDEAANYGAIGAVIGHEMTHGFDDEGHQYGIHGNLENWWRSADEAKFKQRSACLVAEYGHFTAVDDVAVNGELTLGENTADNGGIRLALAALKKRLGKQQLPPVDGFAAGQRFFISYAQTWCGDSRPEAARLQALTDPHSPVQFRVNGVVSNLAEFRKAFHCPVGKPMAPEKMCRVW
jgi:endothelin-converting enzyme/putative endopeptidase